MSDDALRDQRELLILRADRVERHYRRELWANRELFAILDRREVV